MKIKKRFLIMLTIATVIVLATTVYAFNFQLFDTNYSFEYAEIKMPSGEVIKGDIDSWRDYEDSDVVQVKIKGTVYLTHYNNVVLVHKE